MRGSGLPAGAVPTACVRRGHRRGTIPVVTDDFALSDLQLIGGRLAARLVVPADHAILRGHFPGAPLVPGVLLLEAVRRACERVCDAQFTIAEVRDVRFARPLVPDAPATLDAVVSNADGYLEVEGSWHGEAGRIATLVLRLAPRPA